MLDGKLIIPKIHNKCLQTDIFRGFATKNAAETGVRRAKLILKNKKIYDR